jgi:hypothetical protein
MAAAASRTSTRARAPRDQIGPRRRRRSGPGTGFSIVATLTNGQLVEVLCWTTGTSVNGYNIWTRLDTADDSPQYVSDFYLDTGHVQDHLPQC